MSTFLILLGIGIPLLFAGLSYYMPTSTGFSPEVHNAFIYAGDSIRLLDFILPVSELLTVLPFALLFATLMLIIRMAKWVFKFVRGTA